MLECYIYDGLESFVSAMEEPPTNESNFQSRERMKGGTGAWTGGLGSWEATKTLWREGWPEGIERMREALGRLETPRVQDMRRKARWADEGDEFDRDRLYSGHYDTAWRQMKRSSRVAPKAVRISVDVEAHANEDGLFWRGACAVLLAESLGVCGYPTQVVATSGAEGMSMQGGQYRQHIGVIVKDFGAPTYLPTLISTTGHNAFLRVGVFAHNVQKMPSRHTGGMGWSLSTSEPHELAEMGFNEPNVRTVSVPRGTRSFEQAQAWVQKTVSALEEPIRA